MAAIRRKLTLFGQLKTLNSATSDDPRPTPGYMYDEICKVTFNSTNHCSELEDDLLNRLKRKSPHTKAKVLKILKHLVEKGHEGFKLDLQRRTEEVRACMSFKGKPDTLHGDTYNALVRSLAAELMEVIFDSNNNGPRTAPGQGPSVIKSESTSLSGGGGGGGGSSSLSPSGGGDHGGGGGGYGPIGGGPSLISSERMVGFGNSETPTEKRTMMGRLKENAVAGAQRLGSKVQDFREKHNLARNATKEDESNYTNYNTGGGGYSAGYKAPDVPENTSGGFDGPQPTVSIDAAYESRLVDEITMPAGVRAAPDKVQLGAFVSKCSSLDSYKIATLLQLKLDSDQPVKTRVRALFVIEALLLGDIPAIADCFASVAPVIQGMQSDANSTIRELSIRIVDILQHPNGDDVTPTHDAAPPPVATPPAAPVASLLDFGGPEPAATAAPGGGGMFAGMTVTGDTGAATAEQDLSSVLGGGPPTGGAMVAPTGTVGGGGMFGGMVMGGETGGADLDVLGHAPSAVPQQQPPVAVASVAPPPAAVQLMGGSLLLMDEPTLPAAPVSTSSSFDPLGGLGGLEGLDLSAGSSSTSVPSSTSSSAGSSFTFIGGGSGGLGGGLQQQPMNLMAPQQQQPFHMQPQPPFQQQQQSGFSFVNGGSGGGGGAILGSGAGMMPQQRTSSGPQYYGNMGGMGVGGVVGGPGVFSSGGSGSMASNGGSMRSSSSSSTSSANKFGFGSSPQKSSDPFGFISNTVADEKQKK